MEPLQRVSVLLAGHSSDYHTTADDGGINNGGRENSDRVNSGEDGI